MKVDVSEFDDVTIRSYHDGLSAIFIPDWVEVLNLTGSNRFLRIVLAVTILLITVLTCLFWSFIGTSKH